MNKEMKQMKKMISPILERNRYIEEYQSLSNEEKMEIIKTRFSLTHGKGNKSKRKKKKK